MNADGVVVIEARLNDIPLEKQLKYVENKLNAFEKQMGKNGFNDLPESTLRQYDELLAKQKEITAQIQKQGNANAINQANVNRWVDGVYTLSNGMKFVKKDADELSDSASKIDFNSIKKQIDGVGNSLTKAIKKVGKWALAVFGLRSAYMAVRNAINVIAGDDEQLKADIDMIKASLAYTIEPIVRTIVNLAKQLMQYIAYIVKAWTGRDIFASASKNLKSANKSAKELGKTSASFDKFTKLSASKNGGAGGGISDLKTPEDADVPRWIKWIADNGGTVITIIEGIGIALVALKLGSFLQTLGLFASLPLWQVVAGLALIIAGIALAIKGVIDFINDPSWESFLTILEGIALVIAGIAILMGGWIVALVALGVAIVAYVIKNWDKVKEILGKVGTWIYDHIIKPVGNFFSGLWDGIKKGVEGMVSAVKKIFNGLITIVKTPLNWIIDGVNKIIGGLNSLSIKIPSWVPKVGGQTWGINISKVPRLAKGGIVNMPGRGINYGGANIAEKSAEAIVPFSDPQQMEILGQSIGKHVKINADITLELESRVLARVMKEIENNYSFARNGG